MFKYDDLMSLKVTFYLGTFSKNFDLVHKKLMLLNSYYFNNLFYCFNYSLIIFNFRIGRFCLELFFFLLTDTFLFFLRNKKC